MGSTDSTGSNGEGTDLYRSHSPLTKGGDDFDAAAIREKYRQERDKRLTNSRGDITDLSGDLSRYLSDPYTKPTHRDALRDEVDAVIVGGGFGGLVTSVRLREAGLAKTRIIDTAGDVGGVWYWNRYPGAMCDVESLVYFPLLEEMGYTPERKYSLAPEILAYAQSVARKFDLYPEALFQTTVEGATWDEVAGRWRIRTDRGDDIAAKFLVLANGPFSLLKLPDIPGFATFEGESFHTSRWDYDYTGGTSDTLMPKLKDKVVGVVGTGATAVQVVPPVGRSAKQLFVFQRTPSTIAERANKPIERDWVAKQQPGWQSDRRRNFTAILTGGLVEQDLVDDGWTDLYRSVMFDPNYAGMTHEEAAAARERADFVRMEAVRDRVDATVHDRETAEALKPYYKYFCKRPCFHDDYLEAYNLPNVSLVDTHGRGIDEVYAKGVIVGGVKYELDLLVYATGFESNTAYTRRIGFDVVGRNGLSLTDKWANGVATLHGLMTHDFPNLFIMPTPNSQSVVPANFTHLISENAQHLAYIAGELQRKGFRVFDVAEEAESKWVQTILDNARDNAAFLEACTPGRYNVEGNVDARPRQNTNYGPGPLPFFDLLADWRAEGSLDGLTLEK